MGSPEWRHEQADAAGRWRASLGQLRDRADNLDASVVLAAREIDRQPTEKAREHYLDMLVKLTHVADGVRALVDGEMERVGVRLESIRNFDPDASGESASG
ncbi:hypothetical protein SAMN05216174_11993 [Actinokineospora iranica]|uniref:Uncharacterized protein n=2 Tax=Actinokineospora iranica TaxID=1271860 RepID=A0A1G6Y290_9PSEU|nr:hypothetical protein SAMN05216174_11993 [Actinokineospora iranica]